MAKFVFLAVSIALSLLALEITSSEVNPDLYYERMENLEAIVDPKSINYSTISPPESPLTLYIKLIVRELIDLDVKKEQLVVMAWLRLIWRDWRLAWDEELFGIREVRVYPKSIWTPDVVFNVASEVPKNSRLPATVDSLGYVWWFLPATISTKCQADVTFFPFDVQTCYIDLGSWTYPHEMIELTLLEYKTLLERTSENIQWVIKDIGVSLIVRERYSEFHESSMNYSRVQYSLTISRKPNFYVYCMFVPILLAVCLGSVTFLIPADNGAKLTFPISMFLALFVNQISINQFVPPSADTMPLVTILCTGLASLLALNVAQTALTLRLFHSGTSENLHPISAWATRVLHFLESMGARSFLYSRLTTDGNQIDASLSQSVSGTEKAFNELFMLMRILSIGDPESRVASDQIVTDKLELRIEQKLKKVVETLDQMKEHQSVIELVHSKWHLVAAGVDILFLVAYFICLALIFLYLLVRCI